MCWSFISGVKQLLAAIKAAKALHAEESDAAGREAAVGSPRDPGPGAWGRPKQKPIRRQTDWQDEFGLTSLSFHFKRITRLMLMSIFILCHQLAFQHHYQWLVCFNLGWISASHHSPLLHVKKASFPAKDNYKSHLRAWPPNPQQK